MGDRLDIRENDLHIHDINRFINKLINSQISLIDFIKFL